VSVLYLADGPQRDAIIDRGVIWNWAIPAILVLLAAFVVWLLVVILRSGAIQKPDEAVPQTVPPV
jgi:hypothetical protein